MKMRTAGICICTFLMIITPGIVAHSININQEYDPLPIKKVKEIPVPWQFWQQNESGIFDIIILYKDVANPVAIVRDYVILEEAIPLDNLTWENTSDLDWLPIDDPEEPCILEPDEQVEYYIPLNENDSAVLLRYTVAWASTPEAIETHFINEAILESGNRTINGSLSNFDVNNSYNKDITNFELEIFGQILDTDVLDIYDPPGDPYKSGDIWYGGWGTPAIIDLEAYGIEIAWINETLPIQPSEWFHYGVTLKPDLTLWGARAHLTVNTTSRDITINQKTITPKNKMFHNPFVLRFLELHPKMFPILRQLLGL